MRVGLLWVLVLGLACWGCGDDDGPVLGDGGADTSMSDGGGDDGGGDDGGGDDGGGDDGGDDGGGDDGGGDDASPDDAGPGACRNNSMCADTEYCAAPAAARDMCAATGTCEARPEACTDEVDPVCGCDGADYSNPCEAAAAGARVASEGMCPTAACELTARDTCCYTDDDCGRGTVCRSAACVRGGEGTCVPTPTDGECWANSDCSDAQRCMGAVQCECGALCIVPDSPGRCVGRTDA